MIDCLSLFLLFSKPPSFGIYDGGEVANRNPSWLVVFGFKMGITYGVLLKQEIKLSKSHLFWGSELATTWQKLGRL